MSEICSYINDLKSKDKNTQLRATKKLTKIGVEAINPLIDTFKRSNKRDIIRERIVVVLGEIGDPLATDFLLEVLKFGNETIRSLAACALERMRNIHTIEKLIAAFDKGFEVKNRVISILCEMGRKEPELLYNFLKEKKLFRRNNLKTVFKSIKCESLDIEDKVHLLIIKEEWSEITQIGADAIDPLICMFHDQDWGVRQNMMEALWRLDDSRVVKFFAEALKGSSVDLRRTAINVLKKFENKNKRTDESMNKLKSVKTNRKCQVFNKLKMSVN